MRLLKKKLGRLRIGDLLVLIYLILLFTSLFIPALRSGNGCADDNFYTDSWPPTTP